MLGFMIGRAYTFETGGCLNPGIALGLEVFEAMRYDEAGRMKHLWLYILAPILGGLLALWFYLKIYMPFYIEKKQNKMDIFSNNDKTNNNIIIDKNRTTTIEIDKTNKIIRKTTKNSVKSNLHRRSKSFDKMDFEEKKEEEIISNDEFAYKEISKET